MICTSCVATFFQDPMKMGIAIAAILLSLLFFYFSRNADTAKKKIRFLYTHIFLLIFPFIFYIFFSGCSTILKSCHQIAPTIGIIFISIIGALALVALLGPYLFIRRNLKSSYQIKDGFLHHTVKKYAKKLDIKRPQIHILDTAKPVAFSLSAIKNKIFISIGLMELLSKKELEAVALHELGHIKHKSSSIKFWSFFAIMLHPLQSFETMHNNIDEEERKADQIVLRFHNSATFLNTAKQKVNSYYSTQT